VQRDRARVQIGRISRFGLMEMSRQRLKPSLGESTQVVCPRCTGQGTIRTVESLSLSLVRILEEEALKSGTSRVDLQVPIDVATYMLNEKRQAIADIEKLSGVHVLIVANPTLETPHYKVERVRKSDRDEDSDKASYQRVEKESQYNVDITQEKPIQPEQAAVQSIKPGRRPVAKAPEPEVKAGSTGLLGKIVSLFSGDGKAEEVEEKPAAAKPNRGRTQQGRKQGSGQNRNRNRSNRNRNRNRKPDNKQDSTANKQTASKDSKQSQADGSQANKSSGQSSRNRRRSSNRSRSNASNKNESRSNAAPQKNTDTAAAPDKKVESASPAKVETKPKATTEKGGSSGQKKAASTPTPNKAVTDKKPHADKKPAAVKSNPAEKSVDKQPSSNENRSATTAIDD